MKKEKSFVRTLAAGVIAGSIALSGCAAADRADTGVTRGINRSGVSRSVPAARSAERNNNSRTSWTSWTNRYRNGNDYTGDIVSGRNYIAGAEDRFAGDYYRSGGQKNIQNTVYRGYGSNLGGYTGNNRSAAAGGSVVQNRGINRSQLQGAAKSRNDSALGKRQLISNKSLKSADSAVKRAAALKKAKEVKRANRAAGKVNSTASSTVNRTNTGTVNRAAGSTVNRTKTNTVNRAAGSTVSRTNTNTVNRAAGSTVNGTNTGTVNSSALNRVPQNYSADYYRSADTAYGRYGYNNTESTGYNGYGFNDTAGMGYNRAGYNGSAADSGYNGYGYNNVTGANNSGGVNTNQGL